MAKVCIFARAQLYVYVSGKLGSLEWSLEIVLLRVGSEHLQHKDTVSGKAHVSVANDKG